MTIDEAIAHAREVAKEKRKEMQCKTCKLFARSDLHPLQGYCRKNEFRSIEIDSWSKVCSEYVPKEMCKCAEEHEQIAEWLEDYKHIKQWKSDVMDDFCRYDASSFEELIANARNKAIDDFASKLIMHFADWKLSSEPFNDDETDGIGEIICETIENAIGGVEEIAEQLKSTCNKEKCTYTTRKPIEYFDYDAWLQSEAE